MELTAAGTPFIYVPLRRHFEQNIHVRHRLDQYGAGRCLQYDDLTPDTLARAIAAEIGRARLPARRDRRSGPRGGPHRRPPVTGKTRGVT